MAIGDISIHALVKRATDGFSICVGGEIISIHALVKRATLKHSLLFKCLSYFNPRPREEGDKWRLVTKINLTVFQSTPS